MKKIRRPWLRFPPLALAAIAFAAPAATAAGGHVRIAGLDVGRYPEVRLTVLAPPGSTHVSLHENGTPVDGLEVQNLGAQKSVALLVDRSESMRGRALRSALAAARVFVGAKGPNDRIEVIGFGHQATTLQPLTGSASDADGALSTISTDTQSGTALWDAVVTASRQLGRDHGSAHVILLLTDGRDVSSSATFADAVAAAHAANVSVYPIGIAGPDYTPGPLRALATSTGGVYHEAASPSQLVAIYASVAHDLSHTWELSYATGARPGDSLRLDVEVPGAGAASARVALTGLGGSNATAKPSLLPASTWRASWMPLAISLAVGFLALLACAAWFSAHKGRWVRARLEPHLDQVKRSLKTNRRRRRREVVQSLLAATERALANVKQFRVLARLLERADVPLRAAELLYICIGSAIVSCLLAALAFGSALLALLLAIVGGWIPVFAIRRKGNTRLKAFDNQLSDVLITIAASLKAGHSFRHAIQSVVDEGAQPAAKEFSRVLTETQLGRPMEDALSDMAERLGSKNLSFVITAFTIQRQVGGSLAGLFDMVAETVRQRQQFARKVRSLTAMGRISAYILVGLPFFLAATITLLSPRYMSPLYGTSAGHLIIGFGLVMIGTGSAILKKMVAFEGS